MTRLLSLVALIAVLAATVVGTVVVSDLQIVKKTDTSSPVLYK